MKTFDRKIKRLLEDSGLSWHLRKGTKHCDLFIEDEYVYGIHHGTVKFKPEFRSKVLRAIKKHKKDK